jgi:hypothetical protein
MTMTFLSTRTGQFAYFSLQVGDSMWRGKHILDFGGNVGNILRDPNSNIDAERYWCLDVDRNAIEKGRAAWPKAHWVLYNRYCFSFNPYGVRGLPIPHMGLTFDYVVAYSVFTNTTPTDMLELVGQLKSMIAVNGTLAFTFIDPHYYSSHGQSQGNNLQWRVDLEIERGNISAAEGDNIIGSTGHADWFMLINGGDLYINTENTRCYAPEEQKTCYVFHTTRYMKTLFPDATILPPVNSEMQHCCVIRRT